jgi:hypothetical protein
MGKFENGKIQKIRASSACFSIKLITGITLKGGYIESIGKESGDLH